MCGNFVQADTIAIELSGQVVRADLGTAPAGQTEFRDPSIPFCRAGVRDGDVLVLRGCASESECDTGSSCFRSFLQSGASNGICLPDDTQGELQAGTALLVGSAKAGR